MLSSKLARAIPEALIHGENAALALDCFQHQRTNGIVKFGFEVRYIVEAYEFDARNQRLERLAILRRVGNRHGAKCPAVKRIFQRKDSSFLLSGFGATALLFRMRVGARELQRSIDGFRAAVGEKNTIEAGPFREFSRERPLICIVKKI